MVAHFDDVFDHVGHLGSFQVVIFFLTGLMPTIPGFENFLQNFMAAKQDYWCKVNRLQNFSFAQQKYIAIPKNEKGEFSQCEQYDVDFAGYTDSELLMWNRTMDSIGLNKTICSSYVFDKSEFVSTIQMQFGLVCSKYWMVPLVSTIYLAGHLIGAVGSGILADRFGRKPVAIGLIFFVGLSAVVAPFAPTYIVFVLIRLVCGACGMGLVQTSFVILMEVTGPKWRIHVGILFHICFAVGFAMLPGVAYAIRDHIKLQVVLGILPFILLSLIIVLPESPRWLMSQGRYEESMAILRKIAAINQKTLPDNLNLKEMHLASIQIKGENTRGSILDLFRTPNLRKRTLIMCVNWFGTSLGYYGLGYSAGSLPGGVFLNTFISATVQVPAAVLTMIFVFRFGRRPAQIMTLGLAGLFCLASIPFALNPSLPQGIVTALAMTGKMFIAASFCMVYLYAGELYPTVIRSNGVGLCSMCARAGSMGSPQVTLLGDIWKGLPFLVFGTFPLIGSALSFLLPETKDCKLPETLNEGERFPEGCRNIVHETVVKEDDTVANGHVLQENTFMTKL